MRLDLDKLRLIAESNFMPLAARAYGNPGVTALRSIMEVLRKLYFHVSPESISGKLFVIRSVATEYLVPTPSNAEVFSSAEYLAQRYDSQSRQKDTIIQIRPNGDLLLLKSETPNLSMVSERALVYIYGDRRELFVINGIETEITNPSPAHSSIFSIPTFRELTEALQDYKARTVRFSSCRIFSQTWHGGANSNRLFFRASPEATLRDSLTQYLQNVLRGAEVRPEQNVNATRPVDIKVTWTFSNRLALIEIKWMGKSKSDSGELVSHSESRANQGAKQLADYLDNNKSDSPLNETIGYLVVIDARRYGLNKDSTSVTRKNGIHYLNAEILFDPPYHSMRSDFAEPVRMFAEPICS